MRVVELPPLPVVGSGGAKAVKEKGEEQRQLR